VMKPKKKKKVYIGNSCRFVGFNALQTENPTPTTSVATNLTQTPCHGIMRMFESWVTTAFVQQFVEEQSNLLSLWVIKMRTLL